jgi:photosystem II stability/assembly factor-like uncharacterized protein
MEKDNKHKLLKKYLIYIFYSFIIFILSSFNFQGSPKSSGWYQQWFPNMNGSTIASLTFLDSLTGYAVTSTNSSVQAYILKTTNGGDNWNIIYTYVPPSTNTGFIKIQFVNNTIGFAGTNYYDFFKTTNAGQNWINYPNLPTGSEDICALNTDTILYVNSSGFGYGVYRTTNSGISWQGIWTNGGGSGNPNRIYMFNNDIGFSCDNSVGTRFRKTTNGGFNWFSISSDAFHDIKFVDSLTGWKTLDSIKKTTDGGLTWIGQQIPHNIQIITNYILKCSLVNKDSLWGVGGDMLLNNKIYGIIYKTTNGGINWGYQLADTSIHIGFYNFINLVNNKIGWAHSTTTGVHTISGGNDTTFYTGINNITQIPPKNFELKQNYPNPYNNSTLIEYYINEPGWVKLKIFDIAGREMATLVNEVQSTGGYGIPVSVQLSSGVYFYKLVYTNKSGEMQMDVKKLVVLK